MKQYLQHQLVQRGLWLLGATAGGTGLAYLVNAVLGSSSWWLLAAPAALTGALIAGVAGRQREDDGIRHFAHTVNDEIDAIMIGAAETSYFVDSVKKKIEQDSGTASSIAQSSEQNARSTGRMAENAERAAQIAAQVRGETVAGKAEVDQGLQRISSARHDAQAASALMAGLQTNARRIYGFTEAISEISARTNLLALNAAIEAARAGEQGRGFAVVAGEVRQLALRTKEATDEISQMVREINQQAEQANTGMESLAAVVTAAAANVEKVHSLLSSIEQSSGVSEEEIGEIARTSRQQVAMAEQIAAAIGQIRDSMLHTDQELPRAAASAMALAERAEVIAGALGASAIDSSHDMVRVAAQHAAAEVGRLFSAAIKSGQISREALFDRQYQPIPNTDPPKYKTRFDDFTDRVLPALQEGLLASMPQLAYAGAVDNNGYFPTHNKKFSQPLTGDYDVDIVNNRTKRLFSDRTGKRCGANTKPFLQQTYKRDTGEVMHDLSAPLYVAGQHGGGFRIGYRSSAAH